MKLLVIPYGTPYWSPKSPNVLNIIKEHGKTLRIAYLIPLWGLIGWEALVHNTEILKSINGVSERDLDRDTAISIRTWLTHKGANFDKIVLINYGKTLNFWSTGAAGLPVMSKVQIIRWLSTSPSKFNDRVKRAVTHEKK